MDTVAIVGVGLIGGSFALALKEAGFKGRILGVRSESCDDALRLGAIDQAATMAEVAQTADLIYLAQPIDGIVKTIEVLSAVDRDNCLITDAGSTKAEIVATASRAFRRSVFLGGHPMSGKETRGITSAEASLFRLRTYVLTPTDAAQLLLPMVAEFMGWLQKIGAEVMILRPSEHDRIVAVTSHLPQLASTALAAILSEVLEADQLRVAGTGLSDMSRLALSSFDIWQPILETNAEEIGHALDKYVDKLTVFRQTLKNPQLRWEFDKAANVASEIRQKRAGRDS